MAQAIITDGVYFTLNGKQYTRNYIPLRSGTTGISIINVLDNRLQLLPTTPYTEFTVDGGGAYASQELAMVALNEALYANPADGTIGGAGTNSLFGTRIASHTQTAAGSTSYANIGNIGLQNALLTDGEMLEIVYGGLIEYQSGAPILYLQAFSTNMIAGAVAGIDADVDVGKAWKMVLSIARINSTTAKYAGTYFQELERAQTFAGTKTGLDFTAAHAASITWSGGVASDDFELLFGYANKLS